MHSYLLWATPTLVVALAIAFLKWNATRAALLGLALTVPIAFFTGPIPFSLDKLAESLLRGSWIGGTIAPYILGGLLFWRVASSKHALDDADAPAAELDPHARRRRLFFACFLVGPFAESATGFGVGMVGTVMMLRHLGLAPRHLMVFALLSQTFIPWGAMSSGTLLGATYLRVSPTDLALYSSVPVATLMLLWLTLFWATLRQANENISLAECGWELIWVAASLASLVACTYLLGPETALLAAFSPLIIVRYLVDERPNGQALRQRAIACLPYGLIIGWLAATRLIAGLREWLSTLVFFRPFPDLPMLLPLMHSGLWFLVAALLTAAFRKRTHTLKGEIVASWSTGKQAVWTVFLFAMMAEMLNKSGIAQGLAHGLFAALGPDAMVLTPALAGALGIIANTGNAGNSLLLPPLSTLAAQAGINLLATGAVVHVSGLALGFFSPVRMSIAAKLSHGAAQERSVYLFLLPFALAAFAVMTCFAWLSTMQTW